MSKANEIREFCDWLNNHYDKVNVEKVTEAIAKLTSESFAKGYSEQLRLSRKHAANAADLLEIELRKL